MNRTDIALGPQATSLTKQVFAQFPTGVVVLSALVDNRPRAMLISAFSVGVSLQPPLVSAAVGRSSTTWPHLRRLSLLGVSVLAEDQGGLMRDLAGRDRAAALSQLTQGNPQSPALTLEGAAATMEVEIHSEQPAGDHWLIVLEVQRQAVEQRRRPLVYHRAESHALEAPDSEGARSTRFDSVATAS